MKVRVLNKLMVFFLVAIVTSWLLVLSLFTAQKPYRLNSQNLYMFDGFAVPGGKISAELDLCLLRDAQIVFELDTWQAAREKISFAPTTISKIGNCDLDKQSYNTSVEYHLPCDFPEGRHEAQITIMYEDIFSSNIHEEKVTSNLGFRVFEGNKCGN